MNEMWRFCLVMDEQRLAAVAQRIAGATAVLTALLGLMVLGGWALNISLLTTLAPGQPATKPLIAVCLLLLAAALWLRRQGAAAGRPPSRRWRRPLALVFAAAATGVGALTLLEHILGRDFGIYFVMFRRAVLIENALLPGRPAPGAALGVGLLGLALLWIDLKPSWLAGAAAVVGLLVGGLALVGYTYQVTALYQLGSPVPMALLSIIGILLLGVGLLAARPHRPPVDLLVSPGAGGVLLRRLLPAVLLVPLVLGWGWLRELRLGMFEIGFGVALLVVSNALIFGGLIYLSARLLDQSSAQREAAYAELRSHQQQLQSLADAVPSGLLMLNPAGQIEWVNQRAVTLFGSAAEALVGRRLPGLMALPDGASAPDTFADFLTELQASAARAGGGITGVRPDGGRFPVDVQLSQVDTARGPRSLVAVNNITQRRATEIALRHSEERFARAFRASPAAMTVTRRADSVFVEVNDQFLGLVGYARDEVIGRTAQDLICLPTRPGGPIWRGGCRPKGRCAILRLT